MYYVLLSHMFNFDWLHFSLSSSYKATLTGLFCAHKPIAPKCIDNLATIMSLYSKINNKYLLNISLIKKKYHKTLILIPCCLKVIGVLYRPTIYES